MGSTNQQIINSGDPSTLASAAKKIKLGDILAQPRTVMETISASSTTIALSFTAVALCRVTTTGFGAAGEKTALTKRGAAPSTGEAALNAAGTSVVLNAESTGSGSITVVYLTMAPPTGASALTADYGSTYLWDLVALQSCATRRKSRRVAPLRPLRLHLS